MNDRPNKKQVIEALANVVEWRQEPSSNDYCELSEDDAVILADQVRWQEGEIERLKGEITTLRKAGLKMYSIGDKFCGEADELIERLEEGKRAADAEINRLTKVIELFEAADKTPQPQGS